MSATEISGKLEGLQLGDLMKMIRVSRRTGKLLLNDHGQQGAIEFLDGKIVRAQASWDYESLGALLVERGAISEEQLLDAVKTKESNELTEPIGRVLIDLGMTTAKVVQESMRRQVDRVVGQLMRIDRGNFQFQPGRDSADEITQDIGDVLRELTVTVESSLLGTGDDSGRSPSDPRLRELKQHIIALRKARTVPALLTSLLGILERHVSRQILFERRRGGLHAVEVRGTGGEGLSLDRNEVPKLWDSCSNAAYGDTGEERLAALYAQIGAPSGPSYMLVGLPALGRPQRLIYADQGSSPIDLPCLDYVDLLVLEAELLANTVNARGGGPRKRRKRNGER